ncbi:tRNA:m4X modification enzyme [Sorochytrium milnesiophthora]
MPDQHPAPKESSRKRSNDDSGDGQQEQQQQSKKVKETTRSPPPLPSKPNQCHYLVKRKNRYCTLAARKGKKYCGEHAVLEEATENGDGDTATREVRIACPYDNAHSVAQAKLDKHLLKCNSRPRNLSYRVVDVNLNRESAAGAGADAIPPPPPLRGQSQEHVHGLIDKVRRLYQQFIAEHGDIETLQLTHSVTGDKLQQKTNGGKHVLQQSSLIGHLDAVGGLHRGLSFVEFGAGKGELGMYVQQAVAALPSDQQHSTAFYVVDRQNFRMKYDRFIQHATDRIVFERLPLDIKDLRLSLVPSMLPSASGELLRPVVGFSKHLCGGGTDVTLHCLQHYEQDATERLADRAQTPVKAILIALCCHQRCSRDTYVNLPWLREAGLDETSFEHIKQMTGWAINGLRPHMRSTTPGDVNVPPADDDDDDDAEDDEHGAVDAEESEPATTHYSGLSHMEREELGRQAKRVLDYGRVLWLRQHMHFKTVKLIHYVTQDVSLENCALIAY